MIVLASHLSFTESCKAHPLIRLVVVHAAAWSARNPINRFQMAECMLICSLVRFNHRSVGVRRASAALALALILRFQRDLACATRWEKN